LLLLFLGRWLDRTFGTGISFSAPSLMIGAANGLRGYLATFAEPTWVMIPLNIAEQFTRIFSLIVRLFGNVMSGVFIGAIVLALAGLFVPIPFMALELLTGPSRPTSSPCLQWSSSGLPSPMASKRPPPTPAESEPRHG
jgi:F-type H+-transporting ATPase subunit a